MNNYIDISALKATSSPGIGIDLNRTQNSKNDDLLSFLNQVAEHLKSTTDTKNTDNNLKKIPEDIKRISEKITAALKKDGLLPKSLENMPADKLAVKVAELLENKSFFKSGSLKNIDLTKISEKITLLLNQNTGIDVKIKPSLLSDLASGLTPQLNSQKEDTSIVNKQNDKLLKLANILSGETNKPTVALAENMKELNTGDKKTAKLKNKIVNEIVKIVKSQHTATEKTADKHSVIKGKPADKHSVIKGKPADKHSVIKGKPADSEKPVNIVKTLKSEKIDVNHKPIKVSKKLTTVDENTKPDNKNEASKTKTLKTIDKSLINNLKHDLTKLDIDTDGGDESILINIKSQVVKSLKDEGLNKEEIEKGLTSLAKNLKNKSTVNTPPTTAKNIMENKDGNDTESLKTPETLSLKKIKNNSSHSIKKQKHTIKKNTLTPTPMSNESNKTIAQSNISSKISGINLNPQMVNTISSSDGDFNSNMNNGGKQQGLNENGVFLRPDNADGLNNKSFTNFLKTAGGTSSATTEMINLQLKHNINSKVSSMTLQLTPNKLGSLEIKLKFKSDGSVKAHLIVEKPETLAMLQKDSSHLQKILQQTGINADQNSLSFDLKQENGRSGFDRYNENNKNDTEKFTTNMDGSAADEILRTQIAVEAMGYITENGVNIKV